MLHQDLFESTTDDQGRKRPALKKTVPQRLMRLMGLRPDEPDGPNGPGEPDGKEEKYQATQIPVREMRDVQEWCCYTAEFGIVETHEQFPPPVQLVTIPCRSPSGDGHCTRTGEERPCTLFGAFSSVETPDKERVKIIVAPVLPGTSLSEPEQAMLTKKRERFHKSLRQWEEVLAPVNLVLEASTRSVQFWLHSWFGK
ncbi:MAG: hypothetical protein HQL98_06005 [Magnetococcales bacterium]|nr:hypothetical protein [Magnetococcales bacterium]